MSKLYVLLFCSIFFLNYLPLLSATNELKPLEDFYECSVEESLDEELLEKLKTALSSIYNSKKLDFKNFNATKDGEEITLIGTLEFYKEDIVVESVFTTNKVLKSLTGRLKPGEELSKRKFKFLTNGDDSLEDWFPKTIQNNIALDYFTITFDEVTKKPSEIAVSIASVNSWTIIEGGALTFNNISGTVTTSNPAGAKSITASLSGSFNLGGTIITSTASIGNSKADWTFQGDLENLSLTNAVEAVAGSIGGISLPEGVMDIGIVSSSFTVTPAEKIFSLSGSGSIGGQTIGDIQLKVSPVSRNELGFMAGISPSADFKMSKLDSNLKILDDLKITNFGLVLSSHTSSSGNLDVFTKLGGDSSVGRGFNFIGAFDLTADGINLDELIGVESVMIRAVVSNRLSDLLLEGSINANIELGESVTFKKALFRIKPSPDNFKISMGGELEVKVDKDILVFKAEMGVDLTDQAIFVTGLMNGMWNEPFGATGLSIGNLGATVELSFRTTPFPLPAVGIKGALIIKQFEGDMLVFVNVNNPSESAIDAGFNQVSLKAILEEFCDKQTLQKIPQDMRSTILDVSMEDVRLTVAARPITILEKDFDAGFRIKGTAAIGDIAGANLDVQVGYDGIDASAGIKKISHAPFFELKGARGKEDPTLRIVAKASTDSRVAISGSATLLGVTAEADMLLNDKGFDMYARGKIFNAFEADLNVVGSRVTDGGSFMVSATMQQNFMEYVTKNASAEIDKATKKTQEDLGYAQNEVTKAQSKLKALDIEIEKMRNTVRAERQRDIGNIKAARQSVVDEKRSHFNDIANNIKSIQRKIDAAHTGIAKKKREIANAGFGEDAYLAAKYAPYFTEQAYFISTQETAKVAQQGYKEAANLALIAAEEAVGAAATMGSQVPIDADPRIVTLIGSKETANASMEIGKGVLEAAKQVGVGTLSAAKFIVENGPQNVVNITYAHFSTQLSTAHGGTVTITFKGTYVGEPMEERFTFNFDNPLSSVEAFAQSLL